MSSVDKVGLFKNSYGGVGVDSTDALDKHTQDAKSSWGGWSSILEYQNLKSRCDEYFPEVAEVQAAPSRDTKPAKTKGAQ